MKFLDLGAATRLAAEWNEARQALVRARKIGLSVTISRERERLLALPCRFVIAAIEARLADLRTQLFLLGITEIPNNDPEALAEIEAVPEPAPAEPALCPLTVVSSHLDQVDYSCERCGYSVTMTAPREPKCGEYRERF